MVIPISKKLMKFNPSKVGDVWCIAGIWVVNYIRPMQWGLN